MEQYLIQAKITDVNAEEIKTLCEEIFNKQIKQDITDVQVVELKVPHQAEYLISESGRHTLVFNTILVMFKLKEEK